MGDQNGNFVNVQFTGKGKYLDDFKKYVDVLESEGKIKLMYKWEEEDGVRYACSYIGSLNGTPVKDLVKSTKGLEQVRIDNFNAQPGLHIDVLLDKESFSAENRGLDPMIYMDSVFQKFGLEYSHFKASNIHEDNKPFSHIKAYVKGDVEGVISAHKFFDKEFEKNDYANGKYTLKLPSKSDPVLVER